MSLVELIRGIATDEDTFAAARDLALTLGKTPIAAEDFRPYRQSHPAAWSMRRYYTLYEGVGSVEAIDTG